MTRRMGLRSVACAMLAVAALWLVPVHASAASPRENQLFNMINGGRKQRGRDKLVFHPVVLREEKAHAARMLRDGQIHHNALSARARRIRQSDKGIQVDGRMCENVAFVWGFSPNVSVRKLYESWVKSRVHNFCMFDRNFKSQSAAVALANRGDRWYAAFITTKDKTPGCDPADCRR